MKKLPIGISNFRTMIEEDYLYVDKTQTIYDLFSQQRLFFLSRPRRFGKSLLISTLNELFSGNKELFKDTWIGKESDYAWPKHPVMYLDFSAFSVKTAAAFEISLNRKLEVIAEENAIDVSKDSLPDLKLDTLVRELSKKNKVVLLVDEYDYPLLQNLDSIEIARATQKILSSFFATIKSLYGAGNIHALFITGVTKFSQTSLFSGMNNLYDLTMAPEAATLLGYTKDELEECFEEYIQKFAQQEKLTVNVMRKEIKNYYNGYRFSKEEIKVYNPYSVLLCLYKKEFSNYWLRTGTPSFLITLAKGQFDKIKNLETIELSSEALGTFGLDSIHIIPILFQAGYLTIHGFDKKTNKYLLGLPNIEVKDSFYKYLVVALAQSSVPDVERALDDFHQALAKNDIELFCTTLTSLFASIPYQLHVAKEAYYHSLLHFLTTLIGIESESEISSSKGRIDLVIKTKKRIFLFEFKFNGTPAKALAQIVANRYYEKYLRYKKPIILIGLAFNVKKKMFTLDWVAEKYKKPTKKRVGMAKKK